MDIKLFATEIAPCLHITKRFVGSEPLDRVTWQYNQEMKNVLPKYGIEFVEIERMNQKNTSDVISASAVRRYIQERNLSAVQSIVPETTYKYILENLEILIQKMKS